MKNHYKALGLYDFASIQQCDQRYQNLKNSEKLTAEIDEAFAVLSAPDEKLVYDFFLFVQFNSQIIILDSTVRSILKLEEFYDGNQHNVGDLLKKSQIINDDEKLKLSQTLQRISQEVFSNFLDDLQKLDFYTGLGSITSKLAYLKKNIINKKDQYAVVRGLFVKQQELVGRFKFSKSCDYVTNEDGPVFSEA